MKEFTHKWRLSKDSIAELSRYFLRVWDANFVKSPAGELKSTIKHAGILYSVVPVTLTGTTPRVMLSFRVPRGSETGIVLVKDYYESV